MGGVVMIRNKLVLFLVGVMVLSWNQGVWAENSDEPNSLADLIYMGVSVASKKIEDINKAPGIISVITAKDIERMAAETLYDVIKTIPGVTITESYFGYTSVSFRGIKESHYNNRTLLLLNGLPIRDVTVGNYWFEAIPANVIEKIEIIRGPGSVMYGTGAFAGVINVITKSAVDSAEVAVTAGSKTTTNGSLTFAMKQKDYNFIIGGSYNNSTGYQADVVDETGTEAQLGYYEKDQDAYENDFYNVFGDFSLGDFKFDVYHFNQEKDKFGIVPIHATTGEVNMSACGTALHYHKEIEGLQLNSMVHYVRSSYVGYMNEFAGTEIEMRYSGIKYGIDAEGIWEVVPSTFLSGGISYEKQVTDPYEFYDLLQKEFHWASAFLNKYETDDVSVYTQLEFEPLTQLKVLGGVRYNHNREYGDTYVPRVSVVYTMTEKIFLKLLYGSAYRNPTFFEKYVNTRNVLYGNPDLRPEKIDTLELSTDWTFATNVLKLTFFGLTTDDMIGRVVTYDTGDIPAVTQLESRADPTIPTRTTPGYGNTKGQRIYGLEFELKGKIIDNKLLDYLLNCSYKEGKEKIDWSPIQYLDQIVANIVLMNEIGSFINTLTINYVGARKGNIDTSNAAPDFTPGQEIVIPAYTQLNLKTTYTLMENFEISLIVMNLLGQEILYPEYIRRRIDAVPGDSGRNFYGQVKYKF